MSGLADIKIGKKLSLLVGSSILLVVCLTGVAVWALQAIHRAMGESEAESHLMTVSQTVSSNVGGIGQRVASMILSSRRDAQLRTELLALRKVYLDGFSELKRSAATDEDTRLLTQAELSATRWRAADNKALALLDAGKRTEAVSLHDNEIVPRFHELSEAIANYREYRGKRLAMINEQARMLVSRARWLLMALGAACLLLSAVLGFLISRSLSIPIAMAVRYLENVADGDLTQELAPEFLGRKDEVGALAKSVQSVEQNLRRMIRTITEEIGVLSSSSSELTVNSALMSDASQRTSGKAHAVSAATEQMQANIMSVASGMEQATISLASVSSATEEMTATIGEIAGNSEKARRITEVATRQAAGISEQMNQLGAAAQAIGKVTETITEISSQTNLLALNATIEAARAGSAGKGFAVVANEIKELAQQAAAATEDIKGRISAVQSSTAAGIAEIAKVSGVIRDVSDIVSSIAAAIEEQSTVTRDIARNIAEASTGVQDGNMRVSQTSLATAEIAKDITDVDEAAARMTESSEQVRNSAAALSKVSEQLQQGVSRFRVSGASQLVLRNAIAAHSAWTTRLRAAIAGGNLEMPVSTIRSDNQCQFGKWIYGPEHSPAERQSGNYRTAKQLHAQFHEEASKVAQLAAGGHQPEAERAMDSSSEYTRVSSALMNVLNKWSVAA